MLFGPHPIGCDQHAPSQLNTYIGGKPDDIFLIVNDIGGDSGSGFDFINGMTFLERFYTTYDAENSQFSIATTQFTYSEIN